MIDLKAVDDGCADNTPQKIIDTYSHSNINCGVYLTPQRQRKHSKILRHDHF